MNNLEKIILSILLLLFLTIGSMISYAEESNDCNLYWTKYEEKLQPAKKEVEQKLDELSTKPDTSTPYLTNVGVTYLREYHHTISRICDEILELQEQSSCKGIDQEHLKSEYYTKCLTYVSHEMREKKALLEKNMLADAGMKKFQFLVNKYRDLNKKFRELVALVGFIQGKLNSLLKNVGKTHTQCQAKGGA